MYRRSVFIAVGAVVGCFVGLLGPVVFIAGCVWDGRTEWSALTDPELVPYWAVLTAVGALNGGVGAWDGWRSTILQRWPVTWVPLLLLLYPALDYVRYYGDSKTWGVSLLAVAIFAPFIWVAGRVGQDIGRCGAKFGTRVDVKVRESPIS